MVLFSTETFVVYLVSTSRYTAISPATAATECFIAPRPLNTSVYIGRRDIVQRGAAAMTLQKTNSETNQLQTTFSPVADNIRTGVSVRTGWWWDSRFSEAV